MDGTCLNVATSMIDDLSIDLKPFWKIDDRKYDSFKSYCTAIDKIIKDKSATAIEVAIDDIALTIEIILEFKSISLKHKDVLSKIMFYVEATDIKPLQNEGVGVILKFPSIWEKVL